MTDTETRLRDYLHTQAATVPDDAQGPGLEPAVHRRHWPVLTAAAAIAAVLVLTVTFLTRISSDRTAPVAPPGPVSAAAPKVPYIVYADNALHDGDQKVRLPKGVDTFSGRADGGWLGLQLPMEPRTRVGILQPNGGFRLLGPELSTGPTLSPDRKQVAMVHGLANRQAVVIVVDIASGQEVSRSPVLPVAPAKLVWNQTGIWLRTDEMVLAKLALWKPGSGSTTPVDVTGFDGGLSAPADGDTVVLSTRSGDRKLPPGRCAARRRLQAAARVLRSGGADDLPADVAGRPHGGEQSVETGHRRTDGEGHEAPAAGDRRGDGLPGAGVRGRDPADRDRHGTGHEYQQAADSARLPV